MNNHREIIENDEIDLKELFQLFREKSKYILTAILISLAIGVLYGLYYPKEYESHSIISIGKIFNIPISTPRDLETTLDLINVPGYTDYYSTDRLKYNSNSKTNLEITAICKSASRALELNKSILDTILNRHNYLINKAFKPIDLAIKNIGTQIDFINELLEQDKKMDKSLASLVLLNDSKTSLIIERNKLVHTRVIIQPQIPESHSRPNLYLNVILALLLGLIVGCVGVLIMNHSNNQQA